MQVSGCGRENGKRKTKRLEIYNLSRKVVSVVAQVIVQVVVSGLKLHLCDFGAYIAWMLYVTVRINRHSIN